MSWASEPFASASRLTVLVVDDDEELRLVVGEVLRAEGCRVAHAEDGAGALRILSALTPDLILLDLMMPNVTGWDVLAHLAATRRLGEVPVAVVSGRVTAPPPGAMHLLHKPVELDNLIALVHEVSRRRAPWGE